MKSNSISTLESPLSHSCLGSSHSITDGPADRDDFIRAAKYEREKYQKYVEDIAQKLNHIHGVTRPLRFWESVIGFVLLMHISNCRRVFEFMRNNFDGEIDNVLAVKMGSFRIPENQEVYRDIYEVSNLGDMQLYALYLQLFDNKLFKAESSLFSDFVESDYVSENNVQPEAVPLDRSFKSRIKRYYKSPDVILKQIIVATLAKMVSPTMLLTECYWKMSDKQSIQIRSLGKVIFDRFALKYVRAEVDPDSDKRLEIAKLPDKYDKFDSFFYHTLRWAAPATWLEDFSVWNTAVENYLLNRKSLKFVVNESLSENASLLMAIAREKSVTTIHAEHNYLQHQFVGNTVWLNLRKVDSYLSIGWSANEYSNVLPKGSNFNWYIKEKKDKDIDILFVAGVALKRMPLTSSGYALCGNNNANRYVKMTCDFFDSLPRAMLQKVYYKDYPHWRKLKLCKHECDDEILDKFGGVFDTVDQDDIISTVELISRSKLIIVNYLSTAYLQALISNIPTVILFDNDGHHLTSESITFYDDLLSVGIFQNSSIAAADFISEVSNQLDAWWYSSDVQTARLKFINNNFGKHGLLTEYLINKIV